MQEQPTPPQEDARARLTRRRLLRLGWITSVLVVVGGQLWLLLKLFFAPTTPGEGRGQFALGTVDALPVGSAKHFRRERCIVAHHPTGMLAL